MNLTTGKQTDSPVGMMDVYQEFNSLSEKFKIMKFKSKVIANTHHFCFLCFLCYKYEVINCASPVPTASDKELCL